MHINSVKSRKEAIEGFRVSKDFIEIDKQVKEFNERMRKTIEDGTY